MTDGLRRLADGILGVIRSSAQQTATEELTYREAVIASVREDGRATIRGYPDVLPPKSPTFKMAPGQRVHVVFRGTRPVMVLGHNWKRAQAGGFQVGFGLEQLLLTDVTDIVAGVPTVRKDVYFRNDAQATRLNLSAIINADVDPAGSLSGPFRVGWGQAAADNLFYVLAARYVASPPAGQGSYLPRIYLFRLSRPVGEPAGAATVSATLVRVVDPVTFALPAKYNTLTYAISGVVTTLVSDVPHIWPYSFHVREFIPILESETAVTLLGRVELRAIYQNPNPQWNQATVPDDLFGYLAAARADASALLWEAPTTDEYRLPSGMPGPIGPVLGRECQSMGPAVYVVSEWTASRKSVAATWAYQRFQGSSGVVIGGTMIDVRDGAFLETGALATRRPILDWRVSTTNPGLATVGERRVHLYEPASPGRVLLHLATRTSVSPDQATTRLHVYDVAPATLRTAAERVLVSLFDPQLFYRGAAVQYLGDTALYAIAEDSATAGATWPPATEREKFIASPSQPALQPGTALVEDGALSGKGALADWPAGITSPDPLFSVGISADALRIAYHLVGTP